MRLRALLAALLVVPAACAAPAAAGPSLTVREEALTLHAALRRISAATGYQFTGQGGLGQASYREPPTAQRVRLAWQHVPLGKALRELQSLFSVTITPAGPNEFWVRPGIEPRLPESPGPDVAVSLTQATQTEQYRAVPGGEPPAAERRMELQLGLRALGGDGDALGPLTRLTLVDERERTLHVPLRRGALMPRLPDERRLADLTLPIEGPMPARLRRVEGEVVVYDDVREVALTLPTAASTSEAPSQNPEAEFDGVRVKVLTLSFTATRVLTRVRLEWPRGNAVLPADVAPVHLVARVESGETIRAPSLDWTPRRPEATSAEYHIVRDFAERAQSLELRVTLRRAAGRTVTFRLENVVLPFGQPLALRLAPLNVRPERPDGEAPSELLAPAAFRDARGGSLRLPPLPLPPPGGEISLALGLSKQLPGGGWSPNRWVELAPGEDATALTGLAPGVYRVRMRAEARGADGKASPLGPEQARVVTIRAGAETPWPAR